MHEEHPEDDEDADHRQTQSAGHGEAAEIGGLTTGPGLVESTGSPARPLQVGRDHPGLPRLPTGVTQELLDVVEGLEVSNDLVELVGAVRCHASPFLHAAHRGPWGVCGEAAASPEPLRSNPALARESA